MASTETLTPEMIVRELHSSESVTLAFQYFESHSTDFVEEQIRLCSIPAPPYGESERANYLCQRFIECGLDDAHLDSEGNCLALRQGRKLTPLIVVSAHLDT